MPVMPSTVRGSSAGTRKRLEFRAFSLFYWLQLQAIGEGFASSLMLLATAY